MQEPKQWWRDAVIYQLYIRSFADSDGDGIGDIDGIRSRLDYLAALGVDAIWITPWYPSPQADGGYDVADYRGIAPELGDLDAARALIDESHAVGIRVVLDIVPNHASSEHPWFVQALREGPSSPMRRRFHFDEGHGPHSEEPPNDWQSQFGGSAWDRLPSGEWYLHQFDARQPDLNWEN
ncbi:MAG: alpha-amylase family glycosyl hydrolase, partial [Microbacterium gubbeenense]